MMTFKYFSCIAGRKFRLISVLTLATGMILSCQEQKAPTRQQEVPLHPIDWNNRSFDISILDSVESGKSYLPVNSTIYSGSQHTMISLTVTVSVRNTSETDTLFITRADYFDTNGKRIKEHINKCIFIVPMETIEIVIDQQDRTGGSGGNFIFEWLIPKGSNEPLFESVMLYSLGTSAFSFNNRGWRIK
jgi:hypothetical protein